MAQLQRRYPVPSILKVQSCENWPVSVPRIHWLDRQHRQDRVELRKLEFQLSVLCTYHPMAIIRSSYPKSRVNRDLDHILNINFVVAAAVTIHRAHFVATAVLATGGPVWVSIFRRKGT